MESEKAKPRSTGESQQRRTTAWRERMIAITVVVIAATGAGCNPPNAASERNFHETIQGYHDTQRPCMEISGVYPNTVSQADVEQRFLIELGFATPPTPGTPERPFLQWDLTEAGRAALDSEIPPGGRRARRSRIADVWGASIFCYAERYRVIEIVSYTEPSPAITGAITSVVSYRYEIVNPTEWAPEAKRAIEARWAVPMRAFYDEARVHADLESMTEPQLTETALIQMGDGWRDHRARTME